MCEKLFQLLLVTIGVLISSSCRENISSEWFETSKGVKLYLQDSVSTLFTKLQFEWIGGERYGLADGRGTLVAVDKKGERQFSKVLDVRYGLTSSAAVREVESPGSSAYFGSMRKDKPHGFGVKKEKNRIYIGEFKKGKGEGHVYVIQDDRLYYDGEWKNSLFRGSGKMYAQDGTMYIGDFRKGLYSGDGRLYSQDSSLVYEGQWKNGLYDGYGTLYDSTNVYAGAHVWKEGLLQPGIKAMYDKLLSGADNEQEIQKYYERIQSYEKNKGCWIAGLVLLLLSVAIMLYCINAHSARNLAVRKKPIKIIVSYLLWLFGGVFGLHRAYLLVLRGNNSLKVLILSQYLLFAILAAINLSKIAVYGFNLEIWRELSSITTITVVLSLLNIIWMLFDMIWIPYRIHVLTGEYYRRSVEEMDVLKGNKTEVEKFYEALGPDLDKINNEFREVLNETHSIVSKKFVKKETGVVGLVNKLAASVARDGSLEFEKNKLESLILLAEKASELGNEVQEKYETLFKYLTNARIMAYRNLYLTKELIACIRTMAGKKQAVVLDAYNKMEAIDIDFDKTALYSISIDVSSALKNFSSYQRSLTTFGVKSPTATLAAFGISAVEAVVDNIKERKEQKLKAVKAQSKVLSSIEKYAVELARLNGEILRDAEKVSALFEANKAFIHAYCHLRDTVFGDVSFKNFIKGVNKNNPEFRSEWFSRDIQHLIMVSSEYNKINQAK